MLSMKSRGHAGLVVGGVVIALVSGCATGIEGAREAPFDWRADVHSSNCTALSGNYQSAGMPAPANALAATYGSVWPAEGALLSIIELGSNANPRKRVRAAPETKLEDVVPAVSIDVDASGAIRFDAKDAKGNTVKLRPPAWACESGMLATRVAMGSAYNDSYVRLWKHGNDLIAEQTVGVTHREQAVDAQEQKPIARFYYRFRSTAG
ncbi:MAG TPA: hypothetical protein VMF52_00135 [Steroidobacteraceae bacterium]|nr:hypothetical protein [Steroidobacteraceae bacterium]